MKAIHSILTALALLLFFYFFSGFQETKEYKEVSRHYGQIFSKP